MREMIATDARKDLRELTQVDVLPNRRLNSQQASSILKDEEPCEPTTVVQDEFIRKKIPLKLKLKLHID